MFYDGSALWPRAVALSAKYVDRLSRSFLARRFNTLCVTHSGRLSVPAVVLHLCPSCQLCGGPFLYPRFSSRPIAAPIGRPARYFERKKEKRRNGKEERKKKREKKEGKDRKREREKEWEGEKRWQRHGSLSRERTERDRRCGCASVGRYVSTINILLREFLSIHSFWSDVFNKIRIEISIVIGDSFLWTQKITVSGFICNCILLIRLKTIKNNNYYWFFPFYVRCIYNNLKNVKSGSTCFLLQHSQFFPFILLGISYETRIFGISYKFCDWSYSKFLKHEFIWNK